MKVLTFKKWLIVVITALILLLVAVSVSATLGTGLGVSRSLSAFFASAQSDSPDFHIIWRVRLPRIFLAVIVGGALSIAGAAFQAILRNPLAEPYILGISSGGALGAVLSILLGLTTITLIGIEISVTPFFAFAGCLATMFFVYALAFGSSSHLRHSIILTGVIVGAFLSAFVLFFTSLVRFDRLQSVIYWMMGNLNHPLEPLSLLALGVYVMAGSAVLFLLSRSFNTLAFGDETARALGTDPVKTRRYAFVAASLVVSAAVSATGLIGFVGLIVPHAVRLLFGSDNRLVIPASFLFGSSFLVAADAVARVIIKNQQLPVGVITALCGAPVFLLLMRAKMKKSYFG